jgi:hypothetical protein
VGPSGPSKPENPSKRLAALELLRAPGSNFVLHLYAQYSGPSSASAAAQLGQDIAQYTASGFDIELVLTYRPADRKPSVDVPGFTRFVGDSVRELGPNRRLVSLQVTNEVNIPGAPSASDGDFPGAEDALIQGVVAAKREINAIGATQIRVGFNWAYQLGAAQDGFWRYMRRAGGRAFRRALDWVGIDAYPGTWGPELPSGLDLASGVRQATSDSLSALRDRLMPLAAIPATVPIHVSETGYPTGPGRTYDMQTTVLRASVQAVNELRATYNVTDYRWFDLRDADSSSASFESQYGLMTDDYAPKPAFSVYAALVAAL